MAGVRAGGSNLTVESGQRGTVLRAQHRRRNGTALRADEVRVACGPRIHHAIQRVSVDADQWQRRAWIQRRPGDSGSGRDLQANHATRNGVRLYGDVLSRAEGSRGNPFVGYLRLLAVVRVPDSCGTLRKLVAAF